ncbi:RNA polymerase sigma factor [Micromonospora zhanjiangensis]
MDDDDLVRAVAHGDHGALRELFSRHAPWLAARLRTVLPAPDVEDVLQETFLAVWRGPGATGRGCRWLAVGHRPAAGGAVVAPPGATGGAADRAGGGRRGAAGGPDGGGGVPGATRRRRRGARPGGQPAAGDVAADVPRGPAGGRGG